jgi:uncharacterized protein (TIRG00374 family)
MEPAKKTIQLKPIVIVLAAGLPAFLLYLFFYVNPAQVAQTLAETNLAIYSLAFLAYVANTVFSSLVWYKLLGGLEVNVSRGKSFLYTWVGLFFEATVPQLGWSAEVSKTYMLNQDSNVDLGCVGASAVWQKMFNMTLSISTLAIGLCLVLINYQLPVLAVVLIGIVLALSILALGLVYYVSLKPSATKTLLGLAVKVIRFFRKNWNPTCFLNKAEGTLNGFHDGIARLRSKPRSLIVPMVFSLVSFCFELSVFFIVFAALGQPIRVDAIFIVFTLTGVLQTVGAAFFIPELVTSWTLTVLNTSSDVAFSIAILTRVVNLWFRLIVSYGALQYAGLRIMRKNKSRVAV